MNKVILLGNVGQDIEVVTFDNGNKIAKTTLATSDHWKDKMTGEKKTATEWHNLVFVGAVVGVVEKYVKKGDKLSVEGKIKTRSFDNKDGVKIYRTEVEVRDVHLLGFKQDPQPSVKESFEIEDDLPF
jgi:single-strand DNA-binding protein